MKYLLRIILIAALLAVPARAAYLNGQITATPSGTTPGLPVKGVPQTVFRTTFAKVVAANGVDSTYWNLLQTGSGQAISQSGGNLVITTGTTANSETCIRSNISWHDSFNLRVGSQLSQRIANNNFYVELVDVIGDSLSYTINSATSVTVTVPGTTWTTAGNGGQGVYIGMITGAAGIPMKATIATVSGTSVTLTVAGWPASGSGTCSLFGWNYHHILYTSTTATNANYDAARNGWATGDTVATINTSASPGHVAQLFYDDGTAIFSDSLIATTVTPTFAVRATRFQNVPGSDVNLYLQIRALNGTTNPASTTTWTVFFASVEDFAPFPVSLQASKYNGAGSPAVAVVNTPAVTVNSGTLTSVTTVANGQTAHSSASTGSPFRIGGRVKTTIDTTLVEGDASDAAITTGQQWVTKPFGSSENDWFFVSPASGTITNSTTPVTIAPARAASIHNYITHISLSTDALGTATEIAVRDTALTCSSQTISSNTLTTSTSHGLSVGDTVIASASTVTGLTAGTTYYVRTVPSATTLTFSATPGGSTLSISGTGVTATLNHYLWRQKLQTTGLPTPIQFEFPTPLRGGTAVLDEVVTLTASTGGVYFNCTGYQGF